MVVGIIYVLFIWSTMGFAFLFAGVPFEAEGFEFVNPVFIYKKCRVNAFGAIFIALLCSLICPLGTIGYWIYKLCTIGRKNEDFEDI